MLSVVRSHLDGDVHGGLLGGVTSWVDLWWSDVVAVDGF